MATSSEFKFPVPSGSKLPRTDRFYKEIINLHEEACRSKQNTYTDPETGFTVFTAFYHLKRGSCCGSGCRHCPYGE